MIIGDSITFTLCPQHCTWCRQIEYRRVSDCVNGSGTDKQPMARLCHWSVLNLFFFFFLPDTSVEHSLSQFFENSLTVFSKYVDYAEGKCRSVRCESLAPPASVDMAPFLSNALCLHFSADLQSSYILLHFS